MDLRWGGGDVNRIRALAQELVGLQPDIIVTTSTLVTVALQRETRTIPIVFVGVADPVASGLVPRLDRPGGNLTGFANLEASLGGKWLELLSEIAPGLKRAALMFDPDRYSTLPAAAPVYMPSLETAARSLKVELIIAPIHSDGEVETAIVTLGREPGGGLVVNPDGFTFVHRASIILAAARNNVPAVCGISDYARDGGLLSYGADLTDTFRRAASHPAARRRGDRIEISQRNAIGRLTAAMGQSETPNYVRGDGSFPRKRSPDAGDGCAANHFQPRLRLAAELDQIADAGAGELGICNGPTRDSCIAKNRHRGDPITRSRGVQRAANLHCKQLRGGHDEGFAPPGRDAIAATSLAASCKRSAVPENSFLGPAPAPSILTLGGGCRRAPGRITDR
jgi:putative ABC transport system substrate-binding protein